MKSLATAINTHKYPSGLATYPFLLRIFHGVMAMITLRNWRMWAAIGKWVKAPGQLLDVGCGAGDFFIPLAQKYPALNCTGIDPNAGAASVCKAYIQKKQLTNACFVQTDVQALKTSITYDYIICHSVLQYITDDNLALQKMNALLHQDGILLLYVPINERRLLPGYAKIMAWLNPTQYDQVAQRQHAYTANTIAQKLIHAGFTPIDVKGCYGFWGKLYYEPYSLLLSLAKNVPTYLALLPVLCIVALLPFFIVCMGLDFYFRPAPDAGNGILIVAQAKHTLAWE